MSLRQVKIIKESVFDQFAHIADEIPESESHRLWDAIKRSDRKTIKKILKHHYSDNYVTKFVKSVN